MDEERFVASEYQPEDSAVEQTLRPHTLRDYVGQQAVKDSPAIASGVNTYDGKVTCKNLADSFDDVDYTDILSLV